MNVSPKPLKDEPARKRIVDVIDETIFVEAGAGSGKTETLVKRVLRLVDSGVEIGEIVAITFTIRAAAELRDRLRRELEKSTNEADELTEEQRSLRNRALLNIDDAAIGTLDGFAYRLLAEHPIEAGLPINFTIRSEVTSKIYEKQSWTRRSKMLSESPELEDDLRIAFSAGIRPNHLRQLGVSMDEAWDRIDEQLFVLPEPIDVEPIKSRLLTLIDEFVGYEQECADPDDKLLERIEQAKSNRGEIAAAGSAEGLALLLDGGFTVRLDGYNYGSKDNWPDKQAVLDARNAVREAYSEAKNEVVERSLRRIASVLSKDVLTTAEDRCKTGQVTFDDLLVVARKLLRDDAEVRAILHDRYKRVLLDEFQDTDPLQFDIAMRLTADPDDNRPLQELEPVPGRLFTVGDPKQSVYRFRGADLALYLKVRERMTEQGSGPGEIQTLTTNFRTVQPVVDWVNETFASMIQKRPDSQPAYEELNPFRDGSEENDLLSGPHVMRLGTENHPNGTSNGEMREAEGRDIAAAIVEAVSDDAGWQVRPKGKEKRRANLEDIAILMPSRTGLQAITDALDEARIPYRTESSGLAYAAAETRALITTLKAISDPGDAHSLVTALRSMLFGIGDDELCEYRAGGGSWNLFEKREEEPDSPVTEAIAFISELARKSKEVTPAELLTELVEGRRLLELGYADTRERDLWRRVRFVIDQARSWSDDGGTTLTDYIDWVESQQDDEIKINEAILPETDDDAVRLMMIHGAKGLEFPIVFVAGLTEFDPSDRGDAKVVVDEGRWGVVAKDIRSPEIADKASEKEKEADEKIRLWYVACTRARDHLVVSTHRTVNKDPKKSPKKDAATVVASHLASTGVREFAAGDGAAELPGVGVAADHVELPEFEAWLAELGEVRVASSTPGAVSVTGDEFVPDTGKDELQVDIVSATDPLAGADAKAERTYRGTDFGNALHAVMERIDFSDPDSAAALAAVACEEQGIPGAVDEVASAVRAVLSTEVVQAASSAPRVWREMWISGELDEQLVEGNVDLMYEGDGGLVIVDYKTDTISAEKLEGDEAGYRAQVQAYGELVEGLTGETVGRGVLVHVANA